MNRQETAKLIAVMLSACPSQAAKLDEKRQLAMLDAYASLLDDLPYEQGNAALRVLLQTRTWMPSVAEIRITALELAQGSTLPGGEAWGAVVKAIGKHGMYKQPGADFTFADSTTARVVAAMDWRMLCMSTTPTADRARFVELYDKLAAQTHRESVSPMLAAALAEPLPELPPLDPRSGYRRTLEAVGESEKRQTLERDLPVVRDMVAQLVSSLSGES